MTLDGFLTFLGLAAAVYAIIPPVARLRIRLQLWPQVFLAVVAILLALYFEFYKFVALPCPALFGRACGALTMAADGPFSPQMAAFLVVLVWMVLAFLVATLLPPSHRSLRPMADLLEQLFHQARYGEAVDFVFPHLDFVARAQSRKLWPQRAHDWLAGNGISDIEDWLEETDETRKKSAWRRRLRPLAMIVPVGDSAQESAERILNLIYLSRQFMEYLSMQRPSAAAQLLTLDTYQRFDFSDRLLGSLVATTGSRLYDEVERNAQYEGIGDNLVVGHNFILRAYFKDARVAERLSAWKPIGDHIISHVRSGVPAVRDKLNGKSEDFENHQWRDPVIVAIAFFDLMIRSAFSQNVENHMWLPYLDHFIDELEQVYDLNGPDINIQAEFPTWASRLIYEIISKLGGWFDLARKAPEGSLHGVFPSSLHSGTPSIPANAARSLGISLRHIVCSQRIGEDFARYMVECVMRDLRYFVQPGNEEARRFLIKCIVTGGGRDNDKVYCARLAQLMSGIDYILQDDVSDLVEAVQEAHPETSVRIFNP
ncbi:membrane hypothetical protein [Agrobacterium tumefaciens str. Kerr 14]|uniref:Uncharacterized protein n=1 Tax=Agrobacterium tumefaciens str. Kerr 14 TaxID=1183424 RepID=A0A1S7SC89_AGRTU|nr:hypothetical protein [Agrobacterium tumefaciens]CUX66071.1 membrane hypothetical protein [Agrobacterium tumefaciens str. Kerr 14]